MTPELAAAREKAVQALPLIITENGIAASGDGRFKNAIFIRDAAYFGIQALSKPQNGELELIREGVRRTLITTAKQIGKNHNPLSGERPNQIPHEIQGETCDQTRLGRIRENTGPVIAVNGHLEMINYFALDANALWNCLFATYVKKTGDTALRDELWDTFEASNQWLAERGLLICGGRDNDKPPSNMWWKDSENSLVDEKGRMPLYPVAPLDVNSFAYLSDLMSADLFLEKGTEGGNEEKGYLDMASLLRARAEQRKKEINKRFWIEDMGVFAPALDARGRPIRIVTSDAVIAMWTHVVNEDKADRIIKRLKKADMITKWGIRTRSRHSKQFNPMDYQNGNPWGHLAALMADACEKYGRLEDAEFFDSLVEKTHEMDFRETHVEDDFGNVSDYLEWNPQTQKHERADCRFQSFSLGGVLARSAQDH